jgi:hypothetical protein
VVAVVAAVAMGRVAPVAAAGAVLVEDHMAVVATQSQMQFLVRQTVAAAAVAAHSFPTQELMLHQVLVAPALSSFVICTNKREQNGAFRST